MVKKETFTKIMMKYSVLFVILLMLGSGVAMFIGNIGKGTVKENGHKFQRLDNKWITTIKCISPPNISS